MLGHQLLKSWQNRHDVRVTVRGPLENYARYGLFHRGNTIDSVDVCHTDRLREVIDSFRPEAVVNCTGVIKQRAAASLAVPSIQINALVPHQLQLLCGDAGARLIQLSTDCVFNGKRGGYLQTDPPDATDLYGRSKALGELTSPGTLTIRSSIIGLELSEHQSLIEWFLAQHGAIRGFTSAIYSGVTTAEMARILEFVLTRQPELHGLWQVAAEPINKYELLSSLSAKLGRQDLTITPDDSFHCDRSLDGTEFARQTGYRVPAWPDMLDELAAQIQNRSELHEAA